MQYERIARAAGIAINQIPPPALPRITSTYTAKIKTDYLQAIDFRYNIRGQLLSMNNATLTVDTLNNQDANDVFGMEMLYNQADGGLGNTAYYNGNLSAVKWMNRTATGSKTSEKSYKYGYDILNRYTDAWYQEKVGGTWNGNGAYNEQGIGYDPNGNILTLKRNGVISNVVARIDSLNYSYDGNRLTNVTDGTSSQYTQNGFKNVAAYSGSTPYAYDDNGNLTADLKKGISNHYNILNRVDSIRVTAGTNQWISYTYDATGTLLRKVQYHTSASVPVMTTDYVDGFVYENGTLAYFATNEGRVRNNGGTLTNEYVITDQQGNARVSFEDNGSGRAQVRQENGYYPFGLVMSSGITPATQPNKKLYNGGSEWQNDYVDLPDYYQTFFRNYDASLGRWVGIDPQAESAESMTPYQYAGNMPNMLNDPLGDKVNPDYVPVQPGWEDPHGIIATLRDFDEADARLAALMHGSGGGGGSIPGAIHISGDKAVQAFFNQLVNTGEVDFNPGKFGGYKFDYQYGRVVTEADGNKYFDMVGGSITIDVGANQDKPEPVVQASSSWFKANGFPVPWYGNFLGPGPNRDPYKILGPDGVNYLKPVDMLDAAAQQHDYGYNLAKAGGIPGALFNRNVAGVDFQLYRSALLVQEYEAKGIKDPISGRLVTENEGMWAEAVVLAFGLLGALKFGSYIH